MTSHSASTSKQQQIQTSLAQALSKHINKIIAGLDYAPLGSNPPMPPTVGTSISDEAYSRWNVTVEKKIFDNGILIK